MSCLDCYALFFFFNDTATTEIYTLSLHDALPISLREAIRLQPDFAGAHTTLATVLRQLGDAEGAAAESRAGMEIAKQKTGDQAALFATNSGRRLLNAGDIEGAISQFRAAISSSPNYAAAHFELAVALGH